MLYRSVASQSCLDVTGWKQIMGSVAKLVVSLKQISWGSESIAHMFPWLPHVSISEHPKQPLSLPPQLC